MRIDSGNCSTSAGIPAAALALRSEFERWAGGVVESQGSTARVFGTSTLHLDNRDLSVAQWIRRGVWEAEVSLAIGRYVRPGMRCLDVGANFGYYTALMRMQSGGQESGGHVWAVEPNPRLVELLGKSVRDSAWSNVTIVPAAIGELDYGDGTLYVNPELVGGATMGPQPGGQPFPCRTRTLDSLVDETGPIDFAKVDIEGGEEAFWHFGRRAVKQIGVIALEVCAARYKAAGCFLADIRREFPVLRMIGLNGEFVPVADETIMLDAGTIYMLWLER